MLSKLSSSTKLRFLEPNNLYFFALSILVIGLPTSLFLMSVAQIALVAIWLLEGNFTKKWNNIKQNKIALIFASVFVLHVLGLIHTENFNFALKDLRIKLPLLILPLLFASIDPLEKKKINILVLLFISSILFATGVSMFHYLYYKPTDVRYISVFISHIRFSLLICVAIAFIIYFLFKEIQSKKLKVIAVVIILWLLVFLNILQSVTGIGILIATLIIFSLIFIFRFQKIWVKIGFFAGAIAVVVITFFLLKTIYQKVTYFDKNQLQNLEKYTISGNEYWHDTTSRMTENGNLVKIYICEKELMNVWHKRSLIHFYGLDYSGQQVNSTLIRFLASKGLRKDSVGISSLTDAEIEMIENGIASISYTKGNPLTIRIKKIFWEFNQYKEIKNPSNHSVMLRWELWRASWGIIKENWLFGIGTGDVYEAFNKQYNAMNSPLEPAFRLRSHNQYLSFFIVFGIFGLLWFLFSLFYPFALSIKDNYLYVAFICIAAFSMLAEDTLETQPGVTFFAFFNAFIFFWWKNKQICYKATG